MSSSDDKQRSGKRRISLPMTVAMAGVVVLVGTGAAFVYWWTQSDRDVRVELTRLKAAGDPITPEELEAFYRLPEGAVDTTALYLKAIEPLDGPAFKADAGDIPLIGQGDATQRPIPLPGQEWSRLSEAETLLRKYFDSVSALYEAAAQGAVARYPIDSSAGLAASLSHLQKLRTGARLLVLDAHVKSHHGDTIGAADAICATFRLGESLRHEPVLVSQLIRIAIFLTAQSTVEQLLPAVVFSDQDLRRIQTELRKPDFNDGLWRAMIGERVLGTLTFRDPTAFGQDVPADAKPDATKPITRNDDYSAYLAAR
jgi:hypothetical protein